MNIRYPIYEGVYRILTEYLPLRKSGKADIAHGGTAHRQKP